MSIINVILTGAAGKMGREAVKAISQAEDLHLAAAVTASSGLGQDAGSYAGLPPLGLLLTDTIPQSAFLAPNTVLVDLTGAGSACRHGLLALDKGLPVVIGATGLSAAQLQELQQRSAATGKGAIIAPNFAIGALVMMKLAQLANQYFDWVEIIELHHEKKKDAPSGTAIKTASLLAKERPATEPGPARGERHSGIPIHSIRLPGLVAHQEILFGALGQTLTLRHDTLSREAFMPGLLMAIRKVTELDSYLYGLENLL